MSARFELEPFAADHLEAAGALLAQRHRAHVATEPLLANAYTEPSAAVAAVREAFESPDASGAVAIAGGEVVGYLIGAPKADPVWGPNLWVEAAGLAVAEAELARDLYAAAATRWVDEGRTVHFVVLPCFDSALIDAWSRLAFGQQHQHGIRAVPAEPIAPGADVLIRRAERSDIPVLASLEVALPTHQGLAPVFSAGTVPTLESARSEWEADFDDPEFAVFAAELHGRVVGSAVGCSIEKSGTHRGVSRPDGAGFLGFAAVLPESRGVGAGRALGEAVLAWAAEAGYRSVVTDWRVTNLLSSRTWPRLGFRPTYVRMHRVIGY